MNYPLISDYIEAIKSAEDNFNELTNLRPVLDDDGQPVMTSGNFAVVFKMHDKETGKFFALKCFTKEQKGREEAYHLIAEELKDVDSPYLVSLYYLDEELFVDTEQTKETEFPVLLMDWVEGKTLDKYLRENLDDKYALEMLAYRFSQLAQWLIPQPFAHGDLKPDNILVREDGTLVLVDYDGMYVPAMKGQKARELGSPDFRHPLRTVNDFDEHIDDFPLVSIMLSLKAIYLKPQLLEEYGAVDRLLLSKKDYLNIYKCSLIKVLFPSEDNDLNRICSVYTILLSNSLSCTLPTQLFRCCISLSTIDYYFELGQKYKKGIECNQNGMLSVRYYRIAADLGHVKAQYKLGVCYEWGFGVEIDLRKALYWYEAAAKQGDVGALFNISKIYLRNRDVLRSNSILKDALNKAGILIEKNKDIKALCVLGLCFLRGDGVNKDEGKGFGYLMEAALKGEENAQVLVGFCYKNGRGVKKDQIEALKWFEKAAMLGSSMGQAELGLCYLEARGISENKSLGINWLTKSANQGYATSQHILGDCYFCGDGVEMDYFKAFNWFEKSAFRESEIGQYYLAICYECGYGTMKDREKAKFWYEKAAEQGFVEAMEALRRLVAEDFPF